MKRRVPAPDRIKVVDDFAPERLAIAENDEESIDASGNEDMG